MADNQATIERFHKAFAEGDWKTMADCYAEDVVFNDPFFSLKGYEAPAMWRFLINQAKKGKGLKVESSAFTPTSAHWDATYTYGKNPVFNQIDSVFEFNEEGKITKHTDTFDAKKWMGMALGGWASFGYYLGLKPIVANRAQAGMFAWLKKKGINDWETLRSVE